MEERNLWVRSWGTFSVQPAEPPGGALLNPNGIPAQSPGLRGLVITHIFFELDKLTRKFEFLNRLQLDLCLARIVLHEHGSTPEISERKEIFFGLLGFSAGSRGHAAAKKRCVQ